MSKYMTRSKATQMSDMQRAHKTPTPEQAAPVLTHEEISTRAHEIYVEKGCLEGQSLQNWLQAEQELKNRDEWLQADEEMETW